MNDLIINCSPSQSAAILFGQPWDSFLPPLFGSLIGVFLAYLAARATERYLNVQKRAKWLELIRKELKNAQKDLVEHERNVKVFFAIRNELLKSLVSSGDLSLFAANEAIGLTLIYTRMNNYIENNERINKRINQINYRTNPENQIYYFLLREWDELDEIQKSGDKTAFIKKRMDYINGEISGLETSSKVDIGIMSDSGIDYGKRMKMNIEGILKQKWVKDEKKHWLFPKHMSKSDEQMLEDLSDIPLVPGST